MAVAAIDEAIRNVVGVGKVSYEAFLDKWRGGRVAWMHTMVPHAGRVQVTNAQVYEVRGKDGGTFTSDVAEIFTVRDGKIDSLAIYFDTAPYAR